MSAVKRRLIKLTLWLLLVGMIINLTVAWGFTWWSTVQSTGPVTPRAITGSISSRNGAPPEFALSAVHVGPGRELQTLRAVSQKYDHRGMFMYWIDGRWVDAVEAPGFVSQQYEVLWYSAGFPCLSLHGGEWLIEDYPVKDTSPTRRLQFGTWFGAKTPASGTDAALCTFVPFGPRWPGFVINTLFYAAIGAVFVAALALVRRWRRVRSDLCPACAYPIGTSDVCTECGRTVDPSRAIHVGRESASE